MDELARKAFEVLQEEASKSQTITYGELSTRVEYYPHLLSHPLGQIEDYCRDNGFPNITAIVVRADTGQPGKGIRVQDVDDEQQKVWRHEWPLAKRDGGECAMASAGNWEFDKETETYSSGDFTVVKERWSSSHWEAFHKGVKVKSGFDPLELIDYCEKIRRRLIGKRA